MTDEPKELTLADVDRPIIAIVALKSQREAKEQMMPQMHLPYYQVTIDPNPCRGTTNGYSPSGNFIRFGYAQGDELTGWQPAHEIEIFEVVAEIDPGEKLYPHLDDAQQSLPGRFDMPESVLTQQLSAGSYT